MLNFCQILQKYKLSYTVSRMHVDNFYRRNKCYLSDKVLDVGGTKSYKAGYFNIEDVGVDVEYLNIDPATNPDYLSSGENIPVKENLYDAVILSQVLEHLENPEVVLTEIFRVLKPGGTLLITTPFLFKVHACPNDYQRWTEFKISNVLKSYRYDIIKIETLGGGFSTIVDIVKQMSCKIKSKLMLKLMLVPCGLIQLLLVDILEKRFKPAAWVYEWPLHYGVIAKK